MARPTPGAPDLSTDDPAAPAPAPVAPVAPPAAPAARRVTAPAAAIPPAPAATGPLSVAAPRPATVALPVAPVARRAAPAAAAIPPAPVAPAPRPAPAPVVSDAVAKYEDDDASEPREGGLNFKRLAIGTAVAALAIAGYVKSPEIKEMLRGAPVAQTTAPVASLAPSTPTIPAPTVDPQKGPDAPVTPAESSGVWARRSTILDKNFTPALSSELTKAGAKASLTVECKDGTPVHLYSHNLGGETAVKLDPARDTQDTIYTNHGTLKNPWIVCEGSKGTAQFTSYLK